ncbi:DNA replication regulator Sld3 [Penicillium angulare]|uniref:DNA replication regulator Sld3 n=1 Tax=Penicillium angulare TaxID=116970 RepID=UPI002541E410|nr:DNA replication regulator Sld3 [Penicillium angulare]KAJ5279785.1 DNA replication regulator Sld3 [Penicillium angulare]
MASRVIPTVLDPLNASALNKLPQTAPPSKKRKFGYDTAAGQLPTNSIVIRARAASLSDEPLVLNPITTIPRSKLPLSWLEDASWAHSDAQPGGLFVADIPTLEHDLSTCLEPTVFTVRLLSDGSLYVIERVKRGIYSLTRLARWVHEGDIMVAVKGWQGSSRMNVESDETAFPPPDALNWWQTAQIEEPQSDLGLGDDFAGLQVAVVFEEAEEAVPDVGSVAPSFVDVLEYRGPSVPPASKEGNTDVEVPYRLSESQGVSTLDGMDLDIGVDANCVDAKQSPEELLDGMRDHYLQALYISKTSLAYFAKGPLTRCRTAFQSADCGKPESPAGLVEFYREAILAAKKMDLKYREALPAIVRDALLALSDGEGGTGTKKRKSKKKKLGRNGLYPEEDSFIHKWWKDRAMVEPTGQESSREAESKKHISDLRLRETQLQILLILEVIALESTGTDGSKDTENSQKVGDDKEPTTKQKAKKAQDMNVLLELHLDRLCIWHAVSHEETSAAETAKTSSFREGHMSGKKVESDAVRDFCTEVIIPFYAARLPDKCKLITRKFGVSGGISPTSKKSNKRDRPEPGAEVKRQPPPPQKSRRSLHRVLTDEKAAAASLNRHPSLHRSNTAPTKHEITRDSMEPLLPTVLSGNVRGGIQVKRVENREVDLHAVARQHESKLRKVQMLVDQKKELDAAILALRKPNRELVAKDIAEDATKRVSTGGGSSRKPKNPVRNPHGQGVQVMATPRGNRKRDTVVGLPPLPRSLKPSKSFAGEMDDHSLAESPVMIPSSGRRAISFSGPDSDPFKSRHIASQSESRRRQPPSTELGAIHETPTRPPTNRLLFDLGPKDDSTGLGPTSSSSKGGLFRVPLLPESRNTTTKSLSQPMAPSTPVSSRRKDAVTSTPDANPFGKTASSMIMETPPKVHGMQPAPDTHTIPASPALPTMVTSQPRAQSPPVMISTPVKSSIVPVTPEKSQSKSIYEHLGWDDDEDIDML